MILKNKKATEGEMYLSIWMFLIFAAVGISIAIGISIVLSVFTDARQAEANVLSTKVLDCLTTNFNYSEISGKGFDVYSKCGFSKTNLESFGFYYINISVKNPLNVNGNYSSEVGDKTYDALCELEKLRVKNNQELDDNFPRCSFKSAEILDADTNKQYAVSVLTASNQL